MVKKQIKVKKKIKLLETFGSLEHNIHKALKRFIVPQSEVLPEPEIIKKEFSILDPANVMAITPKTLKAKILLRNYYDSEYPDNKVDTKKLYPKDKKVIASAKYSLEYLKKMIALFDVFDDGVKITMSKDYPMTIENDDFQMTLAPRIDGE